VVNLEALVAEERVDLSEAGLVGSSPFLIVAGSSPASWARA
jgi:hypothetical protein